LIEEEADLNQESDNDIGEYSDDQDVEDSVNGNSDSADSDYDHWQLNVKSHWYHI